MEWLLGLGILAVGESLKSWLADSAKEKELREKYPEEAARIDAEKEAALREVEIEWLRRHKSF